VRSLFLGLLKDCSSIAHVREAKIFLTERLPTLQFWILYLPFKPKD